MKRERGWWLITEGSGRMSLILTRETLDGRGVDLDYSGCSRRGTGTSHSFIPSIVNPAIGVSQNSWYEMPPDGLPPGLPMEPRRHIAFACWVATPMDETNTRDLEMSSSGVWTIPSNILRNRILQHLTASWRIVQAKPTSRHGRHPIMNL